MADLVTIKYKGNQIASMTDSGTKTLKTSGTYCEDDIVVIYTKGEPTSLIIDVDGSKLGTAWVTVCQHELLAQHRDSIRVYWYYCGDYTITASSAYMLGGVSSVKPIYTVADGSTRCQMTDVFNSSRTGASNVDKAISLANDDTSYTPGFFKITTDGKLMRFVQSANKFVPGMYKFIFTWD